MKVQFILLLVHVVASWAQHDLKGHMEPFGSSGSMTNFPVDGENVTPDHLAQKHLGASEPGVLTAGIKHLNVFAKWTNEYLKSQTPSTPDGLVEVTLANGAPGTNVTLPEFVKFSEFLDRNMDGKISHVNYMPLALKSEVEIPKFLACPTLYKEVDEISMLFGGADTKSSLLTYHHEEIVCSLRGDIEFIGVHAKEDFKEHTHIYDDGIWNVDTDKMDLEKYPFLKNATFYKGTIKPGDCIVLPSEWVFQIHSITPSATVNYALPSFALFNKAGDGVCEKQTMTKGASIADGIAAEASREFIVDHFKKTIETLAEDRPDEDSTKIDKANFIDFMVTKEETVPEYVRDIAAAMFDILDIDHDGELDVNDLKTVNNTVENYGLYKKYLNLWTHLSDVYTHLHHLPQLNKGTDEVHYQAQPDEHDDDDDDHDHDEEDDSAPAHDEL